MVRGGRAKAVRCGACSGGRSEEFGAGCRIVAGCMARVDAIIWPRSTAKDRNLAGCGLGQEKVRRRLGLRV